MEKITSRSFLDFKYVSAPTLSPDGKYTAFVVQTANVESNSYDGSIFLINNATKKTTGLTTLSSVKTFCFVDDTTIIFPAVRDKHVKELITKGEEITSYYTISTEGGEATHSFDIPLKGGKATSLSDGNYLLTATFDNNRPLLDGLSNSEREEALAEINANRYDVFEEIPFRVNDIGVTNRKRQRLYIYSKADNKATPITGPLFQVNEYKIEGGNILFTGYEYFDFKPLKSGLYLYNLKSGTTTCLIEPEIAVILMFELNGDKALLNLNYCERHFLRQNGDLYSMDLSTGELTLLAVHDHHNMANSTANSDARLGDGLKSKVCKGKLYFLTTVSDHSYINTYDLTTGEFATLTDVGAVDSLDVDDKNIVFIAFRGNEIGELYRLEEGREVKLTNMNDELFSKFDLSKPEYITNIGTDKIEIHGWVMKPISYVKGNKYPAILHIHGGPKTIFSDIFHNEMQYWAANGYFVFFCNPRGSDGRGNDFGDIRSIYGTVDYVNIMEFMDKVLETYCDIDKDNVGVTGGSYGGFMTNWIIGHTNRFKVACAQRSIANWTTFEGTTDIGYFFAHDQVGASHAVDHDLQWEQSPLKYADKATTPTLFIHGEEDYRCWLVEALQMFTALKMHGVETRLCIFKGENHELSRNGKPKNRIARMEEINAWMKNHFQNNKH